MRPPSPACLRHAGGIALAGLTWFVLVAAAVQRARPEYDWWQAPLSFYLSGPHSAWLRSAYYALGAAALLLGLGLWRGLVPGARYVLAPTLFIAGGLSLAVTATWPGASPGHEVGDLDAAIHTLSAIASFLFVGVAMLLQSSSLHRDPHWRPWALPLLVLAMIAFAALWLHALWRELPRGGSQKAVIALYLWWLAMVAWRLRLTPAGPSHAS